MQPTPSVTEENGLKVLIRDGIQIRMKDVRAGDILTVFNSQLDYQAGDGAIWKIDEGVGLHQGTIGCMGHVVKKFKNWRVDV